MTVGIANLSQEIIDIIASYLQRWEHEDQFGTSDRGRALLPAYATISTSWQYAIEGQTFRQVGVTSTEIDDFSHMMVSRRRRLLRRLELNVILPTYTDKLCAKFETEKDKQSNNQAFTKAIKHLLTLLRSWHDEFQTTGNAPIEQPLRLCIGECYCPESFQYRGREKYQKDVYKYWSGRRHDLFKDRYESSLLRLESVEGIQEIPQITSFHRSAGNRNIEPRSLAMIASRFPNLDSFYWRLKDNERRDVRSRQQTRFDFAEALPMIPRGSLKRITLDWYSNPPDNQELSQSSALIPSFPTTDHLSLAIHAISQSENLTRLDLGGCIVISPSLFWPDPETKRPSWPSLVAVNVTFSMNTADGGWYFTRDENSESDDDVESDTSSSDDSEADDAITKQDPDPDTPDTYNDRRVALAVGDKPYRHFRRKADPSKLNPLFEAAARAATQMPRLQRMTLMTKVRASSVILFEMNYCAPGTGWRNIDMATLDWVVGPSGYEPGESILDIWKQAKGEVVQSVEEQ